MTTDQDREYYGKYLADMTEKQVQRFLRLVNRFNRNRLDPNWDDSEWTPEYYPSALKWPEKPAECIARLVKADKRVIAGFCSTGIRSHHNHYIYSRDYAKKRK